MKIKICGLKRIEDIEYINQAGIDYAGFIFADNSKRKIAPVCASTLKKVLNKNIKSVGVFVNQDIAFIMELIRTKIIDLVQLHGSEDNNFIRELKNISGIEIIKAFKADDRLAFNIAHTTADYVLTDSSTQNSFGGTGMTFDWGLIPETNKKIFLAGGINISNIDFALKQKVYCLDINSGVETDGCKDRQKIIELTERIRKNNE